MNAQKNEKTHQTGKKHNPLNLLIPPIEVWLGLTGEGSHHDADWPPNGTQVQAEENGGNFAPEEETCPSNQTKHDVAHVDSAFS